MTTPTQVLTPEATEVATYQAAVVRSFTAPLEVSEVPRIALEPGQIRVEVEASGLCHTDIHAAHGDWPVKPTPPFVPRSSARHHDLRPNDAFGSRLAAPFRALTPPFAPAARTLSLAGEGGALLLLAHDGRLRPAVHAMGGTSISVALSLRLSGPLVVGTKAGMGALAVGERARIEAQSNALVVMFLAHPRVDAGAYVIADTALLGAGAN